MRFRVSDKIISITLGIFTVLALIICTAGCVQQPAVTFTQEDNNTTVQVAAGSQFAVQLESNPTTGYEWNATVSKGLLITNSRYQQDANPGNMVGVGGNQIWVVKASAVGKQTFSAIYKQPWMRTTGKETAFVLYVNVT